jgi:hypothetical protein
VSRDQELDNWLSKATAGLCDEAKTRIATEIESHVREAIADLREQGMDEADAMRGAVAGLGDVNKARRAFRRIHLTEWEASAVRRVNEPPDLPSPHDCAALCLLLIPFFLIGIFVAIMDGGLWSLIEVLGVVAAILALGVLPIVVRRISQRPRPKRSPARTVLHRAISYLGTSIFVAIAMSSWRPVDIGRIVSDGVISLFFVSFFLFVAYRHLRLWRKLMRADQPSSGMDTGFQDGRT